MKLNKSDLRFLRWLAHHCGPFGTGLGGVSPHVERLAHEGLIALDGKHAATTPAGQRALAEAAPDVDEVFYVDYECVGTVRRAGPYAEYEVARVFDELVECASVTYVKIVECVPGKPERVLAGTCEPPIVISNEVKYVILPANAWAFDKGKI